MKKKFLAAFAVIAMFTMCGFTHCGIENGNGTNNKVRQEYDGVRGFDTAVTRIGDRTYIFSVEKWSDYSDGEQLQLWLPDGNILLVSSFNTILIQSNEDSGLMERLTSQADTVVYRN